jgi:RNA polymerase sigma-70 factor (ECF subfamily)
MDKEWFCAQTIANQAAMFRVARSILKSDADAEDAVQEAITAAYSGLSRLREPDKFRPWILKILANECYEICRGRKPEADIDELREVLPAPAEDRAEKLALWDAVMRLPYDYRSAITLFYYEDMTVRQISETLGLSEAGVRTRLSRGREKLRLLLGEEREQ